LINRNREKEEEEEEKNMLGLKIYLSKSAILCSNAAACCLA
jgi:hypothetical protein